MNRWRVGIGVLAAAIVPMAGCRTPVRDFAALNDPAPFVRARAAGLDDTVPDSRAIPELIAHLEDSDPVVRLSSHEALRERTGEDFGYIPYGTPQERAEAAARWRSWWNSRSGSAAGRPAAPFAGTSSRG